MQTVHKSQEHFLETTYRHIMRRIVRINRIGREQKAFEGTMV